MFSTWNTAEYVFLILSEIYTRPFLTTNIVMYTCKHIEFYRAYTSHTHIHTQLLQYSQTHYSRSVHYCTSLSLTKFAC